MLALEQARMATEIAEKPRQSLWRKFTICAR